MHIIGWEIVGTALLILLGDGVVAAVLLNKSKAQNSGWIVITTGWAMAVMCGVFTSAAFGGPGHLNPAVTIGAMAAGLTASNVGWMCVAGQFAGAFLGAVIVWLHYLPHWRETTDAGIKLAAFCTGPAIRHAPANVISEIIGTFVLVFVAGAIAHFNPAVVSGLGPYLVGALVWGIGLSLGGTTGYAINPARDLGPRIAHAILPIPGKGGSDWNYAWIPVVGPIIGGVIAALLFERLATPTV